MSHARKPRSKLWFYGDVVAIFLGITCLSVTTNVLLQLGWLIAISAAIGAAISETKLWM